MSKLNKLIINWQPSQIHTSTYLNKMGYSPALLAKYKENNWIESLGKGAFIKKGDSLNWKGGVVALQQELDLKVHVGGKSALKLYGIYHFSYLGKPEAVYLFANYGTRLPKWFSDQKWPEEIKYLATDLFKSDLGILSKTVDNFTLKISSRERALFEHLHLVPKHENSWESARLFEGLNILRADLIQKLLEECSSVKVKRLFMVIAEKLNYPWVRKLELEKVDFGSGTRTIDKGGKTNSKYKLVLRQESGDLF